MIFIAWLLLLGINTAKAADVEDVLSTSDQANEAAKASQKKIDRIASDTDQMFNQYQTTLRAIDDLRVYNEQLERQIASQQEEMQSLRDSIDQVTVIERQITPYMLRMIDSLEQFISLDLPFLLEERTERVALLKELMGKANISVAEKLRKVLEAYSIETEYGRTIEAYRDTLKINGQNRDVSLLRIGRVALLYQTLDGNISGVWDKHSESWQKLPDQYRTPIKQGLRIARKQAAPELIQVPVPAPEAAQ